MAGRIPAILDDLHSLLVVRASGQTFIAFLTAVHRTKQIRRMVGNGVLHTAILAEVSGDRDHRAIIILFLRFLGVDGLAIPCRVRPGIPGKRSLHAETVVCILCQFGCAVPRFQNKLCHRHTGKDARLFLVLGKQWPNLCHRLCFRQVLKGRCLHTG